MIGIGISFARGTRQPESIRKDQKWVQDQRPLRRPQDWSSPALHGCLSCFHNSRHIHSNSNSQKLYHFGPKNQITSSKKKHIQHTSIPTNDH